MPYNKTDLTTEKRKSIKERKEKLLLILSENNISVEEALQEDPSLDIDSKDATSYKEIVDDIEHQVSSSMGVPMGMLLNSKPHIPTKLYKKKNESPHYRQLENKKRKSKKRK